MCIKFVYYDITILFCIIIITQLNVRETTNSVDLLVAPSVRRLRTTASFSLFLHHSIHNETETRSVQLTTKAIMYTYNSVNRLPVVKQ